MLVTSAVAGEGGACACGLVSLARIQSVSMEVSQVGPRCTLKLTASLAKGHASRALGLACAHTYISTLFFNGGGYLFLLAITCVWRLHWSVRRGSWSRAIRRVWTSFL